MDEASKRDEAAPLGEAVAVEPPTDDSDTVVRTAAAPFGTCHTPPASFGPLAPHIRLPGAMLPLRTSLATPAYDHDHGSAQHCPRGCPPPVVVPLIDTRASQRPQGEILETTLK